MQFKSRAQRRMFAPLLVESTISNQNGMKGRRFLVYPHRLRH